MRVAFIHPQLGLGGAERLIVDAASGLAARGHQVTIFTTVHDPRASFVPPDAAFTVRVVSTGLPIDILGRLRAPLSLWKMRRLAASLSAERGSFDVAVVDLTAHIVPDVVRALGVPVAVYCHYPDLLLAPRRTGPYAAYRRPIDQWEQRGLGAAARVWVNSRFTQSVFARTFPTLPQPAVLYPGVDTALYADVPPLDPDDADTPPIFLSINRFHPAKSLHLAIDAFALLPAPLRDQARLILAGGFDPSVAGAVETEADLRRRIVDAGLSNQIELCHNPSEGERLDLLAQCRCLVYTPSNEHFGLGPVEAMAAARPVIAAANGGPLETILDGETGLLAAPDPEAFARVMRTAADPQTAARLGQAGRLHATAHFSRDVFAENLEQSLSDLDPPANL